MPNAVITSWNNGPLGPGWFLYHQRNANVFYDGAYPIDLGESTDDLRQRRDAEILTLLMLLEDEQHLQPPT